MRSDSRCPPSALCHICAGTGLTLATSAPGLGASRPRLHRDWAYPMPHLHRDRAHPAPQPSTASRLVSLSLLPARTHPLARSHLPVPTYAFPLNPFPLARDVPTSTDPRFGRTPLRTYHRIAPRRPMHRRTAVLRRDLPARAPAPSFEVPALLGGAHLQPRSQRKKKLAAGPQRQPRRSPWAAKPRCRSACNVGYG